MLADKLTEEAKNFESFGRMTSFDPEWYKGMGRHLRKLADRARFLGARDWTDLEDKEEACKESYEAQIRELQSKPDHYCGQEGEDCYLTMQREKSEAYQRRVEDMGGCSGDYL